MKLKVTLSRSRTHPVDLAVTLDAGAPVGRLAKALATRDPAGNPPAGGPLTLAVTAAADPGGTARELAPNDPVGRAGVRSGDTIAVVPVGRHVSGPGRETQPVGRLWVLSGPEPREYPLWEGTNTVGRDTGNTVVLADRQVSKRHAKINIVRGVVEIIDDNSTNGVLVGGGLVSGAILAPDDRVRLGDTVIAVQLLPGTTGAGAGTSEIPFTRQPRLERRYEGGEVEAPVPPNRRPRHRFPTLTLLAPALVGGLLFLVTRSPYSLLFVLLGPSMLIGTYAEEAWSGRRGYAIARADYRTALAQFDTRLGAANEEEVLRRRAEHPSTSEACAAAYELGPLLWTRRPEQDPFLSVRLGLGSRPSRTTAKLPESRPEAAPDLLAEAVAVAERYRQVDDVPIVARFGECGSLGVAGPPDAARAAARGFVAQLVALHSPADLVVTAVAATGSAVHWEWLKWLPHTDSPASPLIATALTAGPGLGEALVAELENLVARRADEPRGPAVLLVVEPDTPVERARLIDLAERGGRYGVHLLWVAPSVALLPAACRTFVTVDASAGRGTAGFVETGEQVPVTDLEPLTVEQTVGLSRRLAPVVDDGMPMSSETDLPAAVSFLGGGRLATARSAQAVLDRWAESAAAVQGGAGREPSLRVVIGQAAGGRDFALDLVTDGPHALVGGTTGSGKSELLQTWILGMACAYSPARVTFLLVDYKGGSAFGECARLPHTVGLFTDLSPYLVRRALISLNAELRRRETVLASHKAKDLATLETRGDVAVPPRLVIVVDEFAALVAEVPEFVDGVVNVAQRGRSLGLHLILATQRPTGVIKDNLRANTNLRVALRMADEADSTDVLGSAQAAGFDPAVPGRAVARTGPGRLVLFQAAYAGGWTTGEQPPPTVGIEELAFGGGAAWVEPPRPVIEPARLGPHDIQRVVGTAMEAHAVAGLPRPDRPWLPELPAVVGLADLPADAVPGAMVLGLRDDPDSQAQPPFGFNPDEHGNLAVYGTGGTGKSTALRTVAVAAGRDPRDPCHVYVLDFAGQATRMLEKLGHVGAVISGDDPEGVKRLVDGIAALIERREKRYVEVDAGTITEYRQRPDADPDEPRTLLLVDGMGAFRQAYELAADRSELFEKFLNIAGTGRQVGVHVVISADRPGGVPPKLASTIQRRIILRLSEESDYASLGIRADALTLDSPPGRGLLDGADEVQLATLGADPVAQAATVASAGDWVPAPRLRPWPVTRLPERVRMRELDMPAFGLDWELAPAVLESRGPFLLCGPPGSGRTTALRSLCAAWAATGTGGRAYYLGLPHPPLPSTVDFAAVGRLGDDVPGFCAKVCEQIGGGGPGLLVIEGVPEFAADFLLDAPVQALVKAVQAAGWLVVFEGESITMRGGAPLYNLARAARTGLVLQPDQNDGQALGVVFPRLRRTDFLATGRGMYVRRGLGKVVQVALPD